MPHKESRVKELESRLAEAEETLRAIHNGEVDAVVVTGPKGEQVFTLQSSDRPYRLLVEAMSEGALTVIPDGTVLYANSQVAKMVNQPLEHVLGGPWQRLFPVNEHSKFELLLFEAREHASKAESSLRCSDGSLLPVHVSVNAADLNGLQVFAVLLTDISQRKAAEEALRKMNENLESRVQERTIELSNVLASLRLEISQRKQIETDLAKAKSDLEKYAKELEDRVTERTAKLNEMVGELEHFSYTITHDMRAPLRAMQGFGHILRDECADCLNPERLSFLNRIVESANRMDNLILDALNYAKVVQQELRLEPVDASELLRTIIDSYPQFQRPNAEISIEGSIPIVLGNEAALTQCFSNLLGNAVKFVAAGVVPKVRIWAEEKKGGEDMVRLWFEDNGIGIAPQHREKIFVMFQRLSKDYEGTGIGLALVRKVAERMKGKVGFESEPGKGSRFWLDLHRVAPGA